ncbi:hypothetical protein P2W49_15530 [Yersinia intermedia]|nr:hypothetical protein P2W49_15530 [Yersinia intermedia]
MSNNKLQLRHGRVTDPQTRGLVATDLGLIAEWENNEMEGGKNFPDLTGGSFSPLTKWIVGVTHHLLMALFSVVGTAVIEKW